MKANILKFHQKKNLRNENGRNVEKNLKKEINIKNLKKRERKFEEKLKNLNKELNEKFEKRIKKIQNNWMKNKGFLEAALPRQ